MIEICILFNVKYLSGKNIIDRFYITKHLLKYVEIDENTANRYNIKTSLALLNTKQTLQKDSGIEKLPPRP